MKWTCRKLKRSKIMKAIIARMVERLPPICNDMKKYLLPVAEAVPSLKLREYERQNAFMKEIISHWKGDIK